MTSTASTARHAPGDATGTHAATRAAQPRYPVQWIDRWVLPGGKTVTVRPVLPQDDGLALDFVAVGMSTRSRYQRFMMGLRVLPASMARYLTDIDYQSHFALIVETFENSVQQQVAEARFVRSNDAGLASAEFAIAVADQWQALGLGRRLLKLTMAAAASQGIETLYGDVLRDNPAMLQLARSCGFGISTHPNEPRLLRVHRASIAPLASKPRLRCPANSGDRDRLRCRNSAASR